MKTSPSKVLILFNSTHGYLKQLAEAEKRGIEAAGGSADIGRIPPFPPGNPSIGDSKATEIDDVPIIEPGEMLKYDAILFGISTAYGNSTASDWRAFWDNTGGLWFRACLFHKAAGAFVSAGTLGSGLENIFITAITTFAHHGMYFVPLGYKHSLPLLGNMEEIHGGTPWGAGTFTGPHGSREPSDLELQIAQVHGQAFYEASCKLNTFNFINPSDT